MELVSTHPAMTQKTQWSKRLSEVYPGAVVNKSLGLRHEVSQLPRFVSEWLVGKFCETGDTTENLAEMDFAEPPPSETLRAAMIVVTTLPIVMVYPFIQRYFVKGVMVGGIKG